MVTVYSTGCPKCRVLDAKLDSKKIERHVVTNLDAMQSLRITEVPVLEVDGVRMGFSEAIKWVNAQ